MRKALITTTVLFTLILLSFFIGTSKATTNPEPTTTAPPHVSILSLPMPVALVKYPHPRPLPEFWDVLAKCETGGDWENGGYYAGGLGIAQSTWKGYGGWQFAKSPAKATKAEQITIALRIAVEGWMTNEYRSLSDKQNNKPFFRSPVGFSGWGGLRCTGGRPALIAHEPATVLAQTFKWNQKGRVVLDLQGILKVRQTGVYDSRTWVAHQEYIISHNLSRTLAPVNPKVKKPSRVPTSPEKRCPQYEDAAYQAGFAKNQIYIVSYLMWRESRCNPAVYNEKDSNGGSRGLLQVNGVWTKQLVDAGIIKSVDDLYQPDVNLRAGFYLFSQSLKYSRYNYGWKPWSIW